MMQSETAQKLMTNLTKALWDSDLIATRITLAIGEFAWMVMLLWPGESFLRPTYTYMAAVTNEVTWAALFGLSCAAQVGIVMLGDFNSRFSRWFAAWNAALWVYVGVVSPLMSVSPPPAAMGGEMALAISALWVWLRPYLLAEGVAYAARAD